MYYLDGATVVGADLREKVAEGGSILVMCDARCPCASVEGTNSSDVGNAVSLLGWERRHRERERERD